MNSHHATALVLRYTNELPVRMVMPLLVLTLFHSDQNTKLTVCPKLCTKWCLLTSGLTRGTGWFKAKQDLGNLPQKRVAECSHIEDSQAEEKRLCRAVNFHSDISEFYELFQHLEAAYNEVDSVLAANGLATMAIPTNDVHISEGESTATEAVWDHFRGVEKHRGNGGLYEKATKNLDQPYTILEDFTKELYSNNSRADIQAKQIVRRYVESTRDMVVFVSRVSPIEIKHKAIPGLTCHLRGYVVTKPSPAISHSLPN